MFKILIEAEPPLVFVIKLNQTLLFSSKQPLVPIQSLQLSCGLIVALKLVDFIVSLKHKSVAFSQ